MKWVLTTDSVSGFGLVREGSNLKELGSVGVYNGGGFFYTSFFIDPQEQMIGIFMGQMHPGGGDIANRFRIPQLPSDC